MWVGGQRHAPVALPSGNDPVPIVQESGWAQGPVWTDAKNLAPHRDSIPGPSSPYRVAISAHRLLFVLNIKCCSWICKWNENFISFSDVTFHFRNHFVTFREILGLGPNQKSSSSLILIHTGSCNPQFQIAVFISQLWLCLCRKQNEADSPTEAFISSAKQASVFRTT
jgi:hypothetical protein